MAAPRIFVSHSHQDDRITKRLVRDLQAAGADVWVDFTGVQYSDFIDGINEALSRCEWLVLIQTPSSLRSHYVRMEVNAAIHLVQQRRMRAVIPFVGEPCDQSDVPPTWATLHHYDATVNYRAALRGLLHALGLPATAPLSPAEPVAIPSSPEGISEAKLPLSHTGSKTQQVETLADLALQPMTAKAASLLQGYRESTVRAPDVILNVILNKWMPGIHTTRQRRTGAIIERSTLLVFVFLVVVCFCIGFGLYGVSEHCMTFTSGGSACTVSHPAGDIGISLVLMTFTAYLVLLVAACVTVVEWHRGIWWLPLLIILPIIGLTLFAIIGQPGNVGVQQLTFADVLSSLRRPWRFDRLITRRSIAGVSLFSMLMFDIGVGIASFSLECPQHAINRGACYYADPDNTIGTIMLVISCILLLAAWILGLMHCSRIHHRGWFTLVLLTSPIGSFVYGIMGPQESSNVEDAVPALATSATDSSE